MPGEPLIRHRDRLPVPAFPVPALSPATKKIASRLGSNANSRRVSVLPDEGGRSSFMLWNRLPFTRSASGPPQGRTFCRQLVDRIFDQVSALRVALADI